MGVGRPALERLKRAAAFVVTVVVGIAAGWFCLAAEAIEDKLKAQHRPPAKQVGKE